MTFSLAPEARAAGHRLVAHDTIGSTNAEAMTYARAGEAGPLWIVSDRQTAGRGRRGSTWSTPRGNLAATLLLTVDLPTEKLATLGFVAGVAMQAALNTCCGPDIASIALDAARSGDDRFALKWPNDVLADGAKLAGILLETEQLAGGRRAVVIGMGVNVATAPEGLPYPATSLKELGCPATAAGLFSALSAAWIEAHAAWQAEEGFAAIRRRWLSHATGLGGQAVVRVGHEITRGTFETIDEQGRLVLRDEGRRVHTISAGDVHFGVAATLPRSAELLGRTA